ncbi:MAG: D-alanyl-D-alanine carboxypeptidase/D-alanyl-D-alanine-endopeptidase [Prevotella sp.]|jgi:D-alanyl-D-alanine carboxypeptidase/D-alanyl-D-alanine-endopeptidase (penicillin-binding protein 4)
MKRNILAGSLFQVTLMAATVVMLMSCGGGKKENKKVEKNKEPQAVVDTALQSRLDKFAKKPRVKGRFGFYVYDLTADKPVYAFNEKVAQPSASCLKLLSGVAGCYLLGTDYQWKTEIYRHGKIVNDTLRGDLIFKGDLDPQLTPQGMNTLVKMMKKQGIKAISGKVVFDLVLTEPVKSEPHWYPWDLSFSRYGILYKGAPKVQKAFAAALRNGGTHVRDSQLVLGRLPKGSVMLVRFRRPISLVLRRMWKNSSNTQATSLLYTIGHKVDPSQSPTAMGVKYERHFLRNILNERDPHLVVHDGCGLCTYNQLSPLALTTILKFGYSHKDIFRMLWICLPISGVDGTLRTELANRELRGKVRAKTGTLSHPYGISSLAGYCQADNGHLLAFAIMDSDMSVLDARVLQRDLCKAMVNANKKKGGR